MWHKFAKGFKTRSNTQSLCYTNFMQLVHEDKKKRKIENKEEIKFSSSSSYHLIILTARAKGEKQISGLSADDEELTLKIDNKTFPKLDSRVLVDSPAAINGGRLHNLSKIVYFLTYLQGKDHRIMLNTDDPPGTATFESLEIYTFDSIDNLILEPKVQAEDGDRRSWIALALDNIPLANISITVTYSRRKRDSDDVKVKIDGQTKENLLRNIKHFLWYFAGSSIPLISSTKTESQSFTTSFLSGLHYVEIDADRMPILEKIILNFGKKLSIPKRIPTVDDPKWTGDFSDDPDQIILARAIFGEVRDWLYPDKARVAVGWSIRNRVEDSRWPNTYQKVITQTEQYSAFNENDNNRPYVENPFLEKTDPNKTAWYNCYEIAGKIISGKVEDPTSGANHYYDDSITAPSWATKETHSITIKRSDNKAALIFHKL